MRHNAAYTLLELVVSMAAAAVLMAGLASCLHISFEVFDAQLDTVQASKAAKVQADVMRDLGRATAFTTRTADTVTIKVPDETGDSVEETITYAFDPNGTLTMTLNGTSTTLLEDVSASQFSFLARTQAGSAPVPALFDVNNWGTRWNASGSSGVVFEEFTEAKVTNAADNVSLDVPPGTQEGDLLIAAIVTDDAPTPFVALPSWNEITVLNNNGRAVLALWWKNASASEPSSYPFAWAYNDNAYGWMMRFTGHDPANSINTFAIATGSSSNPQTSETTTTANNCLILRLGGFDDDDITEDDCGMTAHTTITMDRTALGQNFTCSGGAAYSYLPTAGGTGPASFTLTADEEYATVTLAIAPESD